MQHLDTGFARARLVSKSSAASLQTACALTGPSGSHLAAMRAAQLCTASHSTARFPLLSRVPRHEQAHERARHERSHECLAS